VQYEPNSLEPGDFAESLAGELGGNGLHLPPRCLCYAVRTRKRNPMTRVPSVAAHIVTMLRRYNSAVCCNRLGAGEAFGHAQMFGGSSPMTSPCVVSRTRILFRPGGRELGSFVIRGSAHIPLCCPCTVVPILVIHDISTDGRGLDV
jgi:hypothetical protein